MLHFLNSLLVLQTGSSFGQILFLHSGGFVACSEYSVKHDNFSPSRVISLFLPELGKTSKFQHIPSSTYKFGSSMIFSLMLFNFVFYGK